MNNICPKCKAELGEKQECANCASAAPATGTPTTNEADPARQLTPASPDNPQATLNPAAKNSGEEKPPPNTPAAPKQPSPPAAARPDPGRPHSSKNMRNSEEFGAYARKKIKQKGKRNVVAGHYKEEKTVVDKIFIGMQGRENRLVVETVSLMELAVKLPRREPQIPGESSYQVKPHLTRLRQEHLLFMSCADAYVALGAAYALLEEMQIHNDQRLLVNFARNPEKSESMIKFFTNLSNEEQKLTAIVVDGFHKEARIFLDWLKANSGVSATDMRSHLRDNNFLLLCLVDSKYLDTYTTSGSPPNPFATWPVSCLGPLLKHHFPEQADSLKVEIEAQKKLGKWKQNEAELCSEIRSLLDDGLLEAIEQRRNAEQPPPIPPETVFKGEHSIEDTLLYVGTYFPDLAPHEFDQVVEWLLADRTTTVTVKTQQHNADGTIQTIETEVQKPLREFWNSNPDKYFASCQIEAVPDSNGTMSIRFAKETYRETLQTQLERRHTVYLQRQFKALQANGFLTSTPNISDRAMSLSINMAIAYPASFGKDWLLNIIVETRKSWAAAVGTKDGALTSFGKHKAMERITLFIRLMLEHQQLEAVVDDLLKDLMQLGMQDVVLYLVRGLQFAPGFDEYYWMKRLADEGDEIIKLATYYHLYSYVKKIGIYPLLAKLETWIPSDDRPLDSYPPSAIFSLRLLVEYCAEVESDRKTQPSHPLFTFADEQAAKENCRRLVSWFFHPAMGCVFASLDDVFTDDTPDRVLPFICELVLEWMFALREPRGSKTKTTKPNLAQTAATNNDLDPEKTRAILIESLALVATRAQREYMLTHWEGLRDFTGWLISDGATEWIEPLDYNERDALRSTRLMVKTLIKGLREAVRKARLRPAAAAMTTA